MFTITQCYPYPYLVYGCMNTSCFLHCLHPGRPDWDKNEAHCADDDDSTTSLAVSAAGGTKVEQVGAHVTLLKQIYSLMARKLVSVSCVGGDVRTALKSAMVPVVALVGRRYAGMAAERNSKPTLLWHRSARLCAPQHQV